MDKKDNHVYCVIGDGEAETGPLATSWHLNKFLNPLTDGTVLPILHLNGFKIANPTVLSRISNQELKFFFYGCGWRPIIIEVDDTLDIYEKHERMAAALEECIEQIKEIYEQILEKNECLSLKDLAVTGSDLIAAGMQPGKEIGAVLNKLLEIVLENPEYNRKEYLLSLLPLQE